MSTSTDHHVLRDITRDLAEPPYRVEPSTWQPAPAELLPSEVITQATDACTRSAEPRTRSAALAELVREIYETTIWRMDGDETSQIEMASLRRVVAEVDAHRRRMGLARGPDD